MNDFICMNDWVFSVLEYSDEFSIDELHKALGAKTTREKKRVSRNLSYLVKKGTLKRLKRGRFKNLNPTSDVSGRIQSVNIDHYKDERELAEQYSEFKKKQELTKHKFEQKALWDYDNRTSVFYQMSQNGNKAGFVLLIEEDDPQLKRVVRYVSNKATGSNLTIFLKGTQDITPLFPNINWF